MTDLNENQAREWPYPVNYGKENEVSADVLVLGGGVAGCHAAISAAKRGAKVVVVDKGAVIRSGSGGAQMDRNGSRQGLHRPFRGRLPGRSEGIRFGRQPDVRGHL